MTVSFLYYLDDIFFKDYFLLGYFNFTTACFEAKVRLIYGTLKLQSHLCLPSTSHRPVMLFSPGWLWTCYLPASASSQVLIIAGLHPHPTSCLDFLLIIRNFPTMIVKKSVSVLFLSHLKLYNIFCASLKPEATLVSSDKIVYSMIKVFSLWTLE